MASLPTDLLTRPAAQSVRFVARRYLEAAHDAASRMDHRADAEAVHDFRVALRRLRTTVRAYRAELRGSVRSKTRRRLRAVAELTNRVRDAEVALAWLQPLRPELTVHERVGLRWLAGRIEAQRARGVDHDLPEARRAFQALERRLRRGLGVYRQALSPADAAPTESFGILARRVLLDQAEHLERLLRAIRAADDPEVHLARIAAKRLRYLLEPLADALPTSAELVARLRVLQDRLGTLHDILELERMTRAGVESVAAERAARLLDVALSERPTLEQRRAARGRDPKAGLVAVATRLRARRGVLFAELRTNDLERPVTWVRDISALTAPLATVTPQAAHSTPRSRLPALPPTRRRRKAPRNRPV